MPNAITAAEERQYAGFYVNSGGDKTAAFRALKPKVRSDDAAERGGQRMYNRPGVQKAIEAIKAKQEQALDSVTGQVMLVAPEDEKLYRTIGITEVVLINEYIATAMLDPSAYYDESGKAKPLDKLEPVQRRQIKRIDWEDAGAGKRRPCDYVLYDAQGARDQLAKIMGLVNPAFDFAGLLALMTGKKKDEAAEEIRRLNHSEGVNWSDIQKKAGVMIDNKTGEVV